MPARFISSELMVLNTPRTRIRVRAEDAPLLKNGTTGSALVLERSTSPTACSVTAPPSLG